MKSHNGFVYKSFYAPRKYNDSTVKQLGLLKKHTGFPKCFFDISTRDSDDDISEMIFISEIPEVVNEVFSSLYN